MREGNGDLAEFGVKRGLRSLFDSLKDSLLSFESPLWRSFRARFALAFSASFPPTLGSPSIPPTPLTRPSTRFKGRNSDLYSSAVPPAQRHPPRVAPVAPRQGPPSGLQGQAGLCHLPRARASRWPQAARSQGCHVR